MNEKIKHQINIAINKYKLPKHEVPNKSSFESNTCKSDKFIFCKHAVLLFIPV